MLFSPRYQSVTKATRSVSSPRGQPRPLLGVERLEDRMLLSGGNFDWASQFGSVFAFGAEADVTASATAVDGAGNVYVVGYAVGALPGQTSAGSGDAFVRKYGAGGN